MVSSGLLWSVVVSPWPVVVSPWPVVVSPWSVAVSNGQYEVICCQLVFDIMVNSGQ